MARELKDYVLKMKKEMENLLGCPIGIEEDENCPVPVKIEFAHNYARDRHVVRLNPNQCVNCYPVFAIMLQTKMQLKPKEGEGGYGFLQPVSTPEQCQSFADMFRSDKKGQELLRQYGPTQFDGLVEKLRVGLVTQATSQVMEMLASDVVLRDYPEAVEDMKAYLKGQALVGAGATKEQLLGAFPRFIVTANRRMNIAFTMKVGELCGEKLIDAYKPSPEEIDAGLDIYGFYRKERDQVKESGGIYGDVLEKMLRYTKAGRFAGLAVIDIAPIDLPSSDGDGLTDYAREELAKFKKNFGDANEQDSMIMTLAMYKVIRELRRWPLESVKSLGMEIALLGALGLSPNKSYRLKHFPNRGEIPGREVLAYYYVSWAMAIPEKLDLLNLPYKKAYAAAISVIDAEDGKNGGNCAKSTRGGVIRELTYALAA